MTDLDITAAWTCCTNVDWKIACPSESGPGSYTVRWGMLHSLLVEAFGCEYGWSCECSDFRYRSGPNGNPCKHIQAVEASELRCAWNQALEPGADCAKDSDRRPCCPECKGPVTAFRVGV